MPRTTPEMAAWGALGNVLVDYFSGNVTFAAEDHGSEIHLKVDNVPVFGGRRKTVTMVLPKGTLEVTKTAVRFKSALSGDNVRFMMDGGKSFAHPHVWENGRPCWGGGQVSKLSALFDNLVSTITWRNVSEDSMNYGHFTSCDCTRQLGRFPLGKIQQHKRRVKAELNYSDTVPTQFFAEYMPGYLNIALKCFA